MDGRKKNMNRNNLLTATLFLWLCPAMLGAQTPQSATPTDVEVRINVKEERSQKGELTSDVIARAVEEGVRRALGERDGSDLVVQADGGTAQLADVATYLRNHPKATVTILGEKDRAQDVYNRLVRYYNIGRNRITLKATKNGHESVPLQGLVIAESKGAARKSQMAARETKNEVDEPQQVASVAQTAVNAPQEAVNSAAEETTGVYHQMPVGNQPTVGSRQRPLKDGPGSIYNRYMTKQEQKGRRIERVSREELTALFIPKGQWLFGGSISYNEWDGDNLNYLVLKDINCKGHTFSASPYVGYFVANNIAVGGRFNYSRYYFNLGNFDLNLGEDFNISLKDLYLLEHNYDASAFVRTYMPLGRSKVFGFFNEVRLTYGYSKGKYTTGTGVEFDGTMEHVNSIQLGFCPGLTAFATNFMAVECSVGVMGLKYKWVDQETNRVETGRNRSGGANFKINLFSVNLGMTFYL